MLGIFNLISGVFDRRRDIREIETTVRLIKAGLNPGTSLRTKQLIEAALVRSGNLRIIRKGGTISGNGGGGGSERQPSPFSYNWPSCRVGPLDSPGGFQSRGIERVQQEIACISYPRVPQGTPGPDEAQTIARTLGGGWNFRQPIRFDVALAQIVGKHRPAGARQDE